QGKAAAGQKVTVKLDRTGLITVNGHAAQAVPDALRNMIAAALDASADRLVIVTADDENRVGEVVRILDVSKQAGALKLAVMKNG
ncbi:MAG: hypothetical protein PHP45_10520, partial [Elusimicrobiales bacterium]|nr:hypothetical protein [Elusimicrobiales bacterium]